MGDVYGSDGWFYEMLIKRLKKNTFRIPDGGEYYKSFVHVDDAVGSMIAILEKESFGESFIIADSMPVRFKEFSNFTADQISCKTSRRRSNIFGKDSIRIRLDKITNHTHQSIQ